MVAQERFLNLKGRHLLATLLDELLGTVIEAEEAVLVDRTDITSKEVPALFVLDIPRILNRFQREVEV
jgi:hypothetical protein